MHSSTIIATLALFCGISVAGPIEKRCTSYGYGTFYSDNACSKNPSEAFSFNNAGCLANEIGRNSIYVQGACVDNGNIALVWSPGNNCNCQNHCANVPNAFSNHCWNLNGNPAANSFRFIEQDCGGNNC